MAKTGIPEKDCTYIRISKDVYAKIVEHGEFNETFNTVLDRIIKTADSAAAVLEDTNKEE